METFPLLAFCDGITLWPLDRLYILNNKKHQNSASLTLRVGNAPLTGGFPTRRVGIFFLLDWTTCWENSGGTGNLRRHDVHVISLSSELHSDVTYPARLMHSYTVYIFSCDQAALWMVQSVRLSVRLSVCPSVCHTFLTMFPSSYHHEIFRSYYQWQKWRPCKRSRSEVKGQGHRGHDPNFRFRTVTPVWIHIWWWNDTYSLMLLRRGALLFFKVIRQISRSHGAKIAEFDPDWAFPDCNSSLNSPMAMKCCTKLEVA